MLRVGGRDVEKQFETDFFIVFVKLVSDTLLVEFRDHFQSSQTISVQYTEEIKFEVDLGVVWTSGTKILKCKLASDSNATELMVNEDTTNPKIQKDNQNEIIVTTILVMITQNTASIYYDLYKRNSGARITWDNNKLWQQDD